MKSTLAVITHQINGSPCGLFKSVYLPAGLVTSEHVCRQLALIGVRLMENGRCYEGIIDDKQLAQLVIELFESLAVVVQLSAQTE
jgi:hypothetical protein